MASILRMKTAPQPPTPVLLVLNQMAGPMTRELVEDLADQFGDVALLTGHPDTLVALRHPRVSVTAAAPYVRGSTWRRMWSWLRYTLHAVFWIWRFPRTVPLLVFSNPPIIIWFAALLRRLRGTPWAVMVHDIYPDVVVQQGMLRHRDWRVRVWTALNRCSYRSADVVMTLGTHMAESLNRQCLDQKGRSRKVDIVPPWADRKRFTVVPREENPFARKHDLVGKLTVVYSGNMGWGHDLDSVLAAARSLRDCQSRIHFVLIGAGPKWDWLQAALSREPEPHVTLLPWLAESEIAWSLTSADLGIVSVEPELSRLAVPSKAYYFLAAQVPLLAICEADTELADLVRDEDCGIVIPPARPKLLQEAIRQAADDSKLVARWRRGAAHAAAHFDRPVQVAAIAQALRPILNRKETSFPLSKVCPTEACRDG